MDKAADVGIRVERWEDYENGENMAGLKERVGGRGEIRGGTTQGYSVADSAQGEF